MRTGFFAAIRTPTPWTVEGIDRQRECLTLIADHDVEGVLLIVRAMHRDAVLVVRLERCRHELRYSRAIEAFEVAEQLAGCIAVPCLFPGIGRFEDHLSDPTAPVRQDP